MYIHYPGNSLGLRWTIYRGLSRITEDFESATLTCFLYSKDNKFPVEATVMSAADGGSYLYIELSPDLQLPDGIYGVSAIWKKNEDRSIARSMREGLFSVVNNQAEATDQGGAANIPVLKFHSSAGTFGYDGMSAYEMALLKGLTTKSETEWVQEQLDVATDQIFDAKDVAVGQAETAITAAKDVAVGQAEAAVEAAKDAAVSAADAAIGESKEDALDAISEAIEGLEVHYDIETDKGAVKDVQLKDGNGNNLMPRTKAEVISINIIHNNEYKGFVAGQCWLPAGLSATSHFSAHTDLIEVKQGDVIIVENYRIYSQATGGGPFCTMYPTNEGTGGTRYNCNDVLVPDPSVSLKYTFTVPQDGWIGINIGVETQSYITACRIIRQQVEEGNLKDKIDELDDGVKRIEDSLYKPVDGKQVDVIIFMGQSNMAGRGIVTDTHPEDAPSVIDGAGYEFRAITDPTKLYPITKTLGVDENVSDGINDNVPKTGGCVPAFVNAYFLATKTPVIAVSASEGNTRSSVWKAGTARLNDAISRLESCVAWLTANGYDIAHRYMVWCQGEADADAGIDAASYSANFANMFAAMQSHGIEKCFMIQIGEYNGSTSGLVEAYQLIQQAQVEICDTTPNVVMVSDSFRLFKARGLMKDQFHYYQDGYNIVGLQAGLNAGVNRTSSDDITFNHIEGNKVQFTTPLGKKVFPQTTFENIEGAGQTGMICEDDADFSISDLKGHKIVEIKEGHIKTKNFDSRSVSNNFKPFQHRIPFKVTVDVTNFLADDFDAVDVNTYVQPTYYDDNCVIYLPDNYTQGGNPVKAIIYCKHGASTITEASDDLFTSTMGRIFPYLVSLGYAIIAADGLPDGWASSLGLCERVVGNYVAVQSTIKAWEYAIENYNIDRNCAFIFGYSQGGHYAQNVIDIASIPIVAAAELSPVCSMQFHQWDLAASVSVGGVTFSKGARLNIARIFGYPAIATNEELEALQYDLSKEVGYDPWIRNVENPYDGFVKSGNLWQLPEGMSVADITMKKHTRCPLKIWCANNDNVLGADVMKVFIKAIKNSGQVADIQVYSSGSHSIPNSQTKKGDIEVNGVTYGYYTISLDIANWFRLNGGY